MGLLGMSLASLASILGGSGIDFALSRSDAPSLGLDWFALNVLLLAALFVPMERLWPLRPAAEHLSAGVDHRHALLPDQSPVRAGDDVPDPRAGAGRVCRARGPGVARGDRRPAARRPVLRRAALRGSRRVLHPPRVPRRARRSGDSTRFTTRASTWTGSPARGCTSSTSS